MRLQRFYSLLWTALLCHVSVSVVTLEKRVPGHLYQCGNEYINPEIISPTVREACDILKNPNPANPFPSPYAKEGPLDGSNGNLHMYPIPSYHNSKRLKVNLSRIVIDSTCAIQALVYPTINGYATCKKIKSIMSPLPNIGIDLGRRRKETIVSTPNGSREEGYHCGRTFFNIKIINDATSRACRNLGTENHVTRLINSIDAQTTQFASYFSQNKGLQNLWRMFIKPELVGPSNDHTTYQIVLGDLEDASCKTFHVFFNDSKDHNQMKFCSYQSAQPELKSLLPGGIPKSRRLARPRMATSKSWGRDRTRRPEPEESVDSNGIDWMGMTSREQGDQAEDGSIDSNGTNFLLSDMSQLSSSASSKRSRADKDSPVFSSSNRHYNTKSYPADKDLPPTKRYLNSHKVDFSGEQFKQSPSPSSFSEK